MLLLDSEGKCFFEGHGRQFFEVLVEGGGDHDCLALGVVALVHDGLEFVFESHFDQTISFVKNQYFDIFETKAFGVLYMVKETTSGCYDEVRSLIQFMSLLAQV